MLAAEAAHRGKGAAPVTAWVDRALIAQELFVSLKTVETHLSHAYAKLGLAGQGSRGKLATALQWED